MTAVAKTYGQIPWLAANGRSGKASQNNYALYAEDNIALNDGQTYLTPACAGTTTPPSARCSHPRSTSRTR
ncbi:hypothetical protein [Kingella potus]|uniref:hypothetical protein n=1 Tax=Kingella potus TaxID=265175 RepID=UPI001FCF9128|nr:hypothetical protein [Kingella potus]UOP01697.1 hypothetical protein LVJ84_06105 [Kingella potus]